MHGPFLAWPDGSEDRRLTSLESRAYTQLKRWILDLELQPGERFTHAELAERLGISNTPLRAALAELEREGFVVNEPYKGARVSPISLDMIHNMYQLREAIETHAVRHAIDTLDRSDFEHIDDLLERERLAIAENDIAAYERINEMFHNLFIDRLENPYFSRIFDTILDHHHRIRRVIARFVPKLSNTRRSHDAIVEAIRAKDPELAVQHVKSDIAMFLELVEDAASDGWFVSPVDSKEERGTPRV